MKFIFFKHLFIFESEREREREKMSGKGQREKKTQNPKQVPGSELSEQNLMRGPNSRIVRS